MKKKYKDNTLLEINKSQKAADNDNVDFAYLAYADLTIRGITHEIIVPYKLGNNESYILAVGSVDIDRTIYNIKYKSGTYFFDLGDKIIYDDFTINFTIYVR